MSVATPGLPSNHHLASPVSAEEINPNDAAKSPLSFFSLPPEVRNMIYDLALVSDHPLDLWPNLHVRNFRSMSSRKCHGEHRLCRAAVTCICEWRWTGRSREKIGRRSDCRICFSNGDEDYDELSERTCPLGNHRFPRFRLAPYHEYRRIVDWKAGYYKISKSFFRDQQDLYFVRKNLAAGPLRTSKLVRTEAAPCFFGKNHFRFSSVGGWKGLLRFFLTIGPDARRCIISMDVVSPYGKFWWPEEEITDHEFASIDQKLDAQSKNDPKLHMAKIAYGQNLASIVGQVCRIMQEDNIIQYLNLIVQEGCYKGLSQASVDHIGRLRLPIRSQVTLVLERNAFLTDKDAVTRIDGLEWNLFCQPGSYIRRMDPDCDVWKLENASTLDHHKYSYLEGLATLFGANDEVFDSLEEGQWGAVAQIWFWYTVEAYLQDYRLTKHGMP